ncbi:MAG: hypothetical protein IT499_07710 [Rubrivivax sp.]|nr:hypothetical protein [Rubrivivax sp.]
MEATVHIVGCVLASQPAAESIDAFVAHVRRERGAVLTRSAQSATFVRFAAGDARLVTLACDAVRAVGPARLRFGFAAGLPVAAEEHGLDVPTRSIVQANELSAGAEDGEVLVSPQLAVWLIEAGVPLRSKRVPLPGGRVVSACTIELAADASAAAAARPVAAAPAVAPASTGARAARPKARAAGGLAPLSPVPLDLAGDEPAPTDEAAMRGGPRAEALGHVYSALLVQAEEIARRQAELEARQDAVLGKMTLVDEGSPSARYLGELESALEVQVARVESRIGVIDQLEQRVGHIVTVIADVERRLSAQLQRREEVDSLKALCDTLLAQLVEAQPRLEAMVALRERLAPLSDEVNALAAALAASRESLAAVDGRVAELNGGVQARREMVEQAEAGIARITHLLADIGLKLEWLDEQRLTIEHVGDRLARLDFSVQEAQNTLRALQREREVAERIEQGIKALRTRAGAGQAV